MSHTNETIMQSLYDAQARLVCELETHDAFRALQQLRARQAAGEKIEGVDTAVLMRSLEAELSALPSFDAWKQVTETIASLSAEACAERAPSAAPLPASRGEARQSEDACTEAGREGAGDAERSCTLTLIQGISPDLAGRLVKVGVSEPERIASLTAGQVTALARVLEISKKRIAKENWIEQAAILATGGSTSFSKDKPSKGQPSKGKPSKDKPAFAPAQLPDPSSPDPAIAVQAGPASAASLPGMLGDGTGSAAPEEIVAPSSSPASQDEVITAPPHIAPDLGADAGANLASDLAAGDLAAGSASETISDSVPIGDAGGEPLEAGIDPDDELEAELEAEAIFAGVGEVSQEPQGAEATGVDGADEIDWDSDELDDYTPVHDEEAEVSIISPEPDGGTDGHGSRVGGTITDEIEEAVMVGPLGGAAQGVGSPRQTPAATSDAGAGDAVHAGVYPGAAHSSADDTASEVAEKARAIYEARPGTPGEDRLGSDTPPAEAAAIADIFTRPPVGNSPPSLSPGAVYPPESIRVGPLTSSVRDADVSFRVVEKGEESLAPPLVPQAPGPDRGRNRLVIRAGDEKPGEDTVGEDSIPADRKSAAPEVGERVTYAGYTGPARAARVEIAPVPARTQKPPPKPIEPAIRKTKDPSREMQVKRFLAALGGDAD